MRKLIYLCGMLLLLGTFSAFITTTFTTKNFNKTALKQQERLAGYFDRGGNTYSVWVEEEPDGFGTVTSVNVINSSSLSVTDFSGTIDPSGVVRVSVTLSNNTTFYYSGRPRTNL